MKKIVVLGCTLLMMFSLEGCGKTKGEENIVTLQESSIPIESIDEKVTSEEFGANNDEKDDIELKDIVEIDFA